MAQAPPGWYPDPAPEAQAFPGRLRYWNGAAWTAHVSQPEPGTHQVPPPAQQPAGNAGRPVRTTPDGQRLAGWWSRVAATLLDGLVLLPLSALFLAPVVTSQWDDLTQYVEDSMRAVEQGTPPPPDPTLFDPWSGPGLLLVASGLALTAVYYLGFWRWKQATPGKLVLGLRIRLRDEPGLPWAAMLSRFAFVNALALGGNLLGPLGSAFGLALLVNYLWPLWDDRNQALHDKVAGTNVVRVR